MLSNSNKGVGGLMDREAIQNLVSVLKPHSLQLVDISQDLETGSPDAYVDSSTETSFIGVQVTRASTSLLRKGLGQFNKSKQYLKHQVCELSFIFFGMIYFENDLRAILFLSLFDTALILISVQFRQH